MFYSSNLTAGQLRDLSTLVRDRKSAVLPGSSVVAESQLSSKTAANIPLESFSGFLSSSDRKS